MTAEDRAVLDACGEIPMATLETWLAGGLVLADVARAEIARRKVLSRAANCTGLAASWCPVCGDCSCPRLASGEREDESDDCPLHGRASRHAEET